MKDLKKEIFGVVVEVLVSTSSLYAQDENWHAVSGTGFTSSCDRPDIYLSVRCQ